MNNLATLIRILPLSLLGLFACENPPPESRFDKVASAYCECTLQLVALNQKAQVAASDTSQRIDFQTMQAEYEKSKECAATLVTRFGKLKPTEIVEVEKSLALKCPDLAAQRDLLRELMGE